MLPYVIDTHNNTIIDAHDSQGKTDELVFVAFSKKVGFADLIKVEKHPQKFELFSVLILFRCTLLFYQGVLISLLYPVQVKVFRNTHSIVTKVNFYMTGIRQPEEMDWLFGEAQLVVILNADLTFDHPKPLFPNVISAEGRKKQNHCPKVRVYTKN